jgi:hypothetical protein
MGELKVNICVKKPRGEESRMSISADLLEKLWAPRGEEFRPSLVCWSVSVVGTER